MGVWFVNIEVAGFANCEPSLFMNNGKRSFAEEMAWVKSIGYREKRFQLYRSVRLRMIRT